MQGSPPPTRGTQFIHGVDTGGFGITPAYAGNTSTSLFAYSVIWDHPRLRGEHLYALKEQGAIAGSPPPTRGTPI